MCNCITFIGNYFRNIKYVFSVTSDWNEYRPLRHVDFNPLNAELNPICNLLALLEAHHIFHVSGLRVNDA